MTAINTKYPDRDLRSNGALRIFYGILLINMICTINKIFSFPLKVLVNFYGYFESSILKSFLLIPIYLHILNSLMPSDNIS